MKSKLTSAPTPGKSGPRPRQSATLRMVAREAGVSASTVSRIINGTVNVSSGLKHAVEAAIAKFDFRPNASARRSICTTFPCEGKKLRYGKSVPNISKVSHDFIA